MYINWLVEKKITINKRVEKNGELYAVLQLGNPKVKVNCDKNSMKPTCTLEISTRVDLLEKIKDITLEELKSLVEEDIKENVKKIFNVGLEDNLDLLNIGVKWYRQNPNRYRELLASGEFYLEKSSLKEVKVKVEVFHFNTYQYDIER